MTEEHLPKERRMKRALTTERREQQLAALAVDLSEERLRNGTASSAEIVYWLNRASPKEELARRNLELQNELLLAKKEAIIREGTDNQIYLDAMNAFAGYQPSGSVIDGEYKEI